MSNLAEARRNMVESQIRPCDVTDVRILAAMRELPREVFLPPSTRELAYIDEDIALTPGAADGKMRHLMAPRSFAKMMQAADIGPTDLVLDVGCGSGYSTAALARLADSVVGLECDEVLSSQAVKSLQTLSVDNAAIVTGPLEDGYPSEAPYDIILLEGSVPQVPQALFDQLKDPGRLLAIVGSGLGKLCVYSQINGEVTQRALLDAGAAPLPGFAQTSSSFTF